MANPLEWSPAEEPNGESPYDHTRAKTPFGDYLITWKSWKDFPSYDVEFQEIYRTSRNLLRDAKVAAQEDYDSRIELAASTPKRL